MAFRSVMKSRLILVLVAALLGVALPAWMVVRGISASLDAEQCLHANLFTIALLREYVAQRGGTWPRDWKDLESLPRRRLGAWNWPQDREKMQRYVAIDFGADLDKVAMQSAESFQAVRPLGPCYSYKHDKGLADLLEVIRQTRSFGKKPLGSDVHQKSLGSTPLGSGPDQR